ncbi:hypothetical protein HK103_003582 [Boothiomyces macroporosus]|uniref:Rab-GAP TBC domain-containing protein n=1 Tax=Boothiomyces macroporosus TaxID=261099 RepID=A0AAD5UI76_9FUNG|nr:hypothetical protein HK103_003582 [Boothiomyces macroporosus]
MYLHIPCNKKGSILYLSILFENVFKEHDAQLFFHLSHNLDCSPLEIAFKWILYAFVGILDCDQVLLLWDRIIGYDSLDILSLTAVAIFDFRRDFLLNCKSRSEVMVMKY